MIKKLSIASVTYVIMSLAVLPAMAQTSPTPPPPSKTDVAACMKAATEKKNAAFRAAKDAREAALKAAKSARDSAVEAAKATTTPATTTPSRVAIKAANRQFKEAREKARDTYNAALRAAKNAFAADRKACVAAAPRAGEKEEKAVRVAMLPLNNSGEFGKATLKEDDGKVEVKLDLVGAPKDVTQPAHIHTGSCASLGAVKYPLNFPVNGKSETTLNVKLAQLKSELPLAINVHKSVAEAGVYVSCGDIKL